MSDVRLFEFLQFNGKKVSMQASEIVSIAEGDGFTTIRLKDGVFYDVTLDYEDVLETFQRKARE